MLEAEGESAAADFAEVSAALLPDHVDAATCPTAQVEHSSGPRDGLNVDVDCLFVTESTATSATHHGEPAQRVYSAPSCVPHTRFGNCCIPIMKGS
jgi:hypothetical protein